MRILRIAIMISISVGTLAAQGTPARPARPSRNAQPEPAAAAPGKIKVFDASAMDTTADPCVNFYQYACGGWIARNPIPADQQSWGRFNELAERNRDVLHEILDKAAAPDPKRSPVMQKIGDFYASCMDESKVNALGAKPIEADLQRIAKIANRTDLIKTIAHLHSIGVRSLFAFGAGADLHDPGVNIANFAEGGLSLPDRDFYFKDDAKSVETRQKFSEHVQKMFELLGDSSDTAAQEAKTVMTVETALAKPTMDRVARRNPANRDHPMTRAELEQMAPGFQFAAFFTAAKVPAFNKANVANPDFFKTVNGDLDSIPLSDWKTYLRWHVVDQFSPQLSSAFAEESFRFRQQYLGGQQEMQARWKRCVSLTDRALGEALGQPYVDQTFGAAGKQRTQALVKAIEGAMGEDLRNLPWMSEETKKQAAVKLAGVENKIGYPDTWRDYSKLAVVRGDHLGNIMRAVSFEEARDLDKIGKPVDKSEWGMTPPTVNAYYNPLENNINFPAGILQPPFYDNQADDAVNFGGIGAVIGHELTHGFDDQGAKFDAKGYLRNWWTDSDKAEFEKRTGCIADEYSGFVAVDDLHVNGRLTLGENTADNGGLRLAFMALQDRLKGKDVAPLDGFTPDQRFFIAWGQIWCTNATPQSLRLQVLTNPHSPGQFRVNGVVSNMPEFQQAFHCQAGQPMVRANACRAW